MAIQTYETRRLQLHALAASGSIQRSGVDGAAFLVPQHLTHFSGRPGQALPVPVQQRMESLFNADLSAVRIHVGSEASWANNIAIV